MSNIQGRDIKNMEYKNQIKALVNHFQEGEKPRDDYMLGLEIEHLILERDSLEAVSYYTDRGIEAVLEKLVGRSWEPVYEEEHLIGLEGINSSVTLEPGGQVELSIQPQNSIREIDLIYKRFLQDITPVLEDWNRVLMAVGYQPVSSIRDIPLLPKERYKYMYDYFVDRGKYAHNMMKGTASIQVNLDYKDEEDYIKKNRVAYFLAPLVYTVFDNGPFFEGELCRKGSIRSLIWENCDRDRCGLIDAVFTEKFGYTTYAEYLLNRSPIIIKEGSEFTYVGGKLIRDIFDPDKYSPAEIDHLLTMVFPDVRTKQHIEIRMGDTLPYPYNFGFLAFWKGLLYDEENLDAIYQEIDSYDLDNIREMRNRIEREGVNTTLGGKDLRDRFGQLVSLARKGLNQEEVSYLAGIEEMATKKLIPKAITLNSLESGKSKREALNWCILNRKGF